MATATTTTTLRNYRLKNDLVSQMLLNQNPTTFMTQADIRGLKIEENDSDVFLASSSKPEQ